VATAVQHTYTFAELKQLWIDAGGSRLVAPLMAAIALAESSGRPAASHRNTNGTVDRGLWQINSVHGWGPSAFDPRANAKQAVAVYRSQGARAWSAYNNGSYARYLSSAAANAAAVGAGSGQLKAQPQTFTDILQHGRESSPARDAVTGALPDVGGWVGDLYAGAKEPAAKALLYLTFTALAIAFLVLGGVKAAGGSVPSPLRRGFRPANPQAAGFPEGF
jgi:hypothetical protein